MRTKTKANATLYTFIALLLLLFCVLKVLRGADTESTQSGGIWNIVSLLFYPLFFWELLKGKKIKIRLVFAAPFLYCIFSMLFSLFNSSNSFGISFFYSYLMIPFFFLVFSVFYFFSDDHAFGNKIILIAYTICLALNLITIFRYQFFGAARPMASDVYYSLGLFPFALLLTKNGKMKAAFFVFQFLTVFLANKRTGLICFVVATFVYFFITEANKGKKNFLKFLKNFLLLAVAFFLLYRISTYIDTTYHLGIYDRLFSIEEDQGSGRSDIYSAVWQAFKNSSLPQKIAGHGMNTAGELGGAGHAHNDFLEILYNFGVPSFLCFVLFYLALFLEAFRMIRKKSPYAAAFCFSIIVGVFMSMFSYFAIFYTYVICSTAFWGYSLSLEKKRTKQKENL